MTAFRLFALIFVALVLFTVAHAGSVDLKARLMEEAEITEDTVLDAVRELLSVNRRKRRAERQRKVVEKLYTSIIWPTSSYIAEQVMAHNYTVVADLMLENVTARINPLGRFDTYYLTGEYYFALAGPLPGQSTVGKSRVTNISFEVPTTCTNNSCWFKVVIKFSRFSDDFNTINYTQMGVMYFDQSDRICSYELNFIGLSRQLDVPETPSVRQGYYTQLCTGIVAQCTGANLQYNGNFTQCMDFLNSIPYGGWGVADQNTVQCRGLHLSLVAKDPAVHCPHVGQTGGDMCIFHSTQSYYEDKLGACADPDW